MLCEEIMLRRNEQEDIVMTVHDVGVTGGWQDLNVEGSHRMAVFT